MKLPFHLPKGVVLVAAGLAVLLSLGWLATRTGPLAPVRVTVAEVARGELRPSLFGIGTVEARRDYLIGPTTAGRVQRVLVDVGEAVVAGQLLAEMEPVDLEARQRAGDAAVARARNAVSTAQAQLSDAASRLALAQTEASRYEDLGRQAFVASSVVDGKRQQENSARAQLAGADAALAGARHDEERLQAERQATGQQRANIRLLAPANGVVTARDAEPGSTVVAGQAVLKMMDPDSLWVRTRLDQSRSSGLRDGLPAVITLRSSAREAHAGKVTRLDPFSDSVTEERIAQVAFERLPAGVTTGEMAEVVVRLPAVQDALLIPNAALRRQGSLSGVWLHEDGKLRFARIRTGAEDPDGRVQVLEGLEAGDAIVVYSERELKAKDRIRVVPSLIGESP
ncbi:MAG: efflux RND transporter periplasmic adaptor subunit [Pseudomonadota bacterium]